MTSYGKPHHKRMLRNGADGLYQCLRQFRNYVCIYTQISLCAATSVYPNIFWVHISQVDLSNIHVTVVGPGEAILRFESVHRNPAGVFVVPRTPRVCHLLVLVPQLQHTTNIARR